MNEEPTRVCKSVEICYVNTTIKSSSVEMGFKEESSGPDIKVYE